MNADIFSVLKISLLRGTDSLSLQNKLLDKKENMFTFSAICSMGVLIDQRQDQNSIYLLRPHIRVCIHTHIYKTCLEKEIHKLLTNWTMLYVLFYNLCFQASFHKCH